MQDRLRTLWFAHQPTQTLTWVRGKVWQTSNACPALYWAAAWHTTETRHGSTWPLTHCYTAAQHSRYIHKTPLHVRDTSTKCSAVQFVTAKRLCYVCTWSVLLSGCVRLYIICCTEHMCDLLSVNCSINCEVQTPSHVLSTNRPVQKCAAAWPLPGEQMYEVLPVGCLTCH